MVSIPAHLETEGCLQGDVLTSKTERNKRRGGVREGHPQSIHLPEGRTERQHKDNVKQKLNIELIFVYSLLSTFQI